MSLCLQWESVVISWMILGSVFMKSFLSSSEKSLLKVPENFGLPSWYDLFNFMISVIIVENRLIIHKKITSFSYLRWITCRLLEILREVLSKLRNDMSLQLNWTVNRNFSYQTAKYVSHYCHKYLQSISIYMTLFNCMTWECIILHGMRKYAKLQTQFLNGILHKNNLFNFCTNVSFAI